MRTSVKAAQQALRCASPTNSVTLIKRCFNCGSRFGLVRHHITTFCGTLQFCSSRCKSKFLAIRERELCARGITERRPADIVIRE